MGDRALKWVTIAWKHISNGGLENQSVAKSFQNTWNLRTVDRLLQKKKKPINYLKKFIKQHDILEITSNPHTLVHKKTCKIDDCFSNLNSNKTTITGYLPIFRPLLTGVAASLYNWIVPGTVPVPTSMLGCIGIKMIFVSSQAYISLSFPVILNLSCLAIAND